MRIVPWFSKLVIILLLSGCSLLPNEEEPLKPPLAKPVEERIVLVQAEKKAISRQIKGTAIFEPTHIAYEQFTESGGIIEEILVQSGDDVQAGDVLIRLDNEGLDIHFREAELDAEKKKLALKQALESRDDATIRIREMELQISEMKLDKARTAYFSKELVASIDGNVIYVAEMKPGDRIQAYKTLVNIADPSALRLYYTTSRTSDLYEVQVGMDVEVTVNNNLITGTVVQTPATAPPAANDQLAEKDRQRIYINLDPIPQHVTFGDNADIAITLQHKDEALVIPRASLRSYFGRSYVQIMDGESRMEQDVKLGIESDIEVEVLEGLTEGQDIIMR